MPPERAGEQAVILSLAAEDAIRREDWEELSVLLRERAREIHHLVEDHVAIDAKDHDFLLRWQDRILRQLSDDKRTVIREVSNLQKVKRAQLAYATTGPSDTNRNAA